MNNLNPRNTNPTNQSVSQQNLNPQSFHNNPTQQIIQHNNQIQYFQQQLPPQQQQQQQIYSMNPSTLTQNLKNKIPPTQQTQSNKTTKLYSPNTSTANLSTNNSNTISNQPKTEMSDTMLTKLLQLDTNDVQMKLDESHKCLEEWTLLLDKTGNL